MSGGQSSLIMGELEATPSPARYLPAPDQSDEGAEVSGAGWTRHRPVDRSSRRGHTRSMVTTISLWTVVSSPTSYVCYPLKQCSHVPTVSWRRIRSRSADLSLKPDRGG